MDSRNVDQATVENWTEILPSWITLDMARVAVVEHFRHSTDYLLPAHVVKHCAMQRETVRAAALTPRYDRASALPAGSGVGMSPQMRAEITQLLAGARARRLSRHRDRGMARLGDAAADLVETSIK